MSCHVDDSMGSATEIWPEPIQNDITKTKLALKFEHHQIMVDSVESSCQVT